MTVLSASEDPFSLADLNFFTYIAGPMKPFLRQYQSTKSMIPYLYDDLCHLLRDILLKFITPDVLKQYKNASNLCDIDLTDAKNQLSNWRLALTLVDYLMKK